MVMPDTVTVLVTGFGPFIRDMPVNLSYLIATTLPASLPPSPACSSRIQIILYPYQIPVSYEEVRSLVPRLYAAYEGRVDIVLHMGMTSKDNCYTIEKLGHRDGYDQCPDIYGIRLPRDDGKVYWPDCPPILETSLNFDDVWTRWRSNLMDTPELSQELDGVLVRPSQDAGNFMCDFIYYSSLAEHFRHKSGRYCDKVDERPVMFMHVPARTGKNDLIKGKLVTISLIRALAESWKMHKGVKKEPLSK